jgi:hypothetical protein
MMQMPGAGEGALFLDTPGNPVSLQQGGARGPPTRAELFGLCHRAVRVGKGWIRSETEAKQLATAIYELTSMPVGPDPAQYVADWYNWMRWQSGIPAEPRAFKSRPRPRATPSGMGDDQAAMAAQMMYQQQMQAAMYQQAQQAMMQQQMYQQQIMAQMLPPPMGMMGPGAMSPAGPMPGSAGYDEMQAAMLAQMQQQQYSQQSQMMGAMGMPHSPGKGGSPMGAMGMGAKQRASLYGNSLAYAPRVPHDPWPHAPSRIARRIAAFSARARALPWLLWGSEVGACQCARTAS